MLHPRVKLQYLLARNYCLKILFSNESDAIKQFWHKNLLKIKYDSYQEARNFGVVLEIPELAVIFREGSSNNIQ